MMEIYLIYTPLGKDLCANAIFCRLGQIIVDKQTTSKKRILHVSYSKSGGAGNVAAQLSNAQSKMFNYTSDFIYSSESSVKTNPLENLEVSSRAVIDNFLVKRSNWPTLFSLTRNIHDQSLNKKLIDFEGILHFHWLNGLLNMNSLIDFTKFGKKIIWTIHDMEPFTGGCHYALDCKSFENSCASCPAVRKVFTHKIENVRISKNFFHSSMRDLTLVFPSKWLLNKFKSGVPQSTSNTEFIPNPVSNIFFGKGRSYDVSPGIGVKPLCVGFVCADLNDPIKQFGLALGTIQRVSQLLDRPIKVIAVGSKFRNLPKKINFILVEKGNILNQKELFELYSSMDLLISNSLSESFGLTIAEASAVGVPCLVLAGTGSTELVEDNLTGFLYRDQVDLINKLLMLANAEPLRHKVGLNARRHASKNWGIESILLKYDQLYERVNKNL
jgi:glycosyltransferase involved in cell wall biosynthesis